MLGIMANNPYTSTTPLMDQLHEEIASTQQLIQNLAAVQIRQTETFEAVARALVVLLDAARGATGVTALAPCAEQRHARLEAAIAGADAALRLLRGVPGLALRDMVRRGG